MTARELFLECVDVLTKSGADSPETDADELCRHFLGLFRYRFGDTEATPEAEKRLRAALLKRAGGYPLQYILGNWTFMDCELKVCEGVLIPRDDTEVCVREVFSRFDGNGTMIDLCSGSGAVAIALAKHYPSSEIYAAELSDTAYDCLCDNIRTNGVHNVIPLKLDIINDVWKFTKGYFDVIISNPPYIRSDEIPSLQKEVQFEPVMALDGGSDGLMFYRAIVKNWLPLLKSGGILSLEIGEEQGSAVSSLLSRAGAKDIRVVKDIVGLDRTVSCVVQ